MRVRAVTFDFWGTLYAGGTAVESERAGRRAAIVSRAFPDAPAADRIVAALHEAANLRDESGRGLTTRERLAWALGELGVSFSPEALDGLVLESVALGVELPPVPLPETREVLEEVSQLWRLGLVSDTGLTPGQALREVMAADGLARHFAAFGFSDETGWSKPFKGAFMPVLDALGVRPEEAVHVGDLAETDVEGALALGMGAVWINPDGAGDDPTGPTGRRPVRVAGLREVPAALRLLGEA